MVQKKFANPADDILAGITATNDFQLDTKIKEESKKVESVEVKTKTENLNKNKKEPSFESVNSNNQQLKSKSSSTNKQISKLIKFSLEVSLRMERILSELKTADPENATAYSKVFFIDEAIMKSINDYEKKLGIKQ